MASSEEFVRHALEMMSAWGSVRARKMFGGHGLYRDDVFFALIAGDTLYLKADEQTRGEFEAAGSAPFVYDGHGESITMSYWRAPDECLESPATMRDWCQLAFGAALRARAARPVKKPAAKRPVVKKPIAKEPVAKKTAAKKAASKKAAAKAPAAKRSPGKPGVRARRSR